MKRATHATETPQVGRSVPRLESWLKVTGRAEYVHNLRLPGMLYGKIFRSSVAHGRIRHIDTPHVPHCWESRLLYEEETRTLLCGDLFTHTGDGPPLTTNDIVGPARAEAFGRGVM